MEKTLEPERLAFLEEPLDEALVSWAGAGAGSAAGASAGASSFFFFLTFFSLSALKAKKYHYCFPFSSIAKNKPV